MGSTIVKSLSPHRGVLDSVTSNMGRWRSEIQPHSFSSPQGKKFRDPYIWPIIYEETMPQHPHQPYLSQEEEYLDTPLHVTKSGRLRMIMKIIISAPLVCAKHSFELPLKFSVPQIRVICSPKTWFCSSVPFLNKWNHHIFFSSNQKLPVFRSSHTLTPHVLCKVKFCQFISAIHPFFFLLLPH